MSGWGNVKVRVQLIHVVLLSAYIPVSAYAALCRGFMHKTIKEANKS